MLCWSIVSERENNYSHKKLEIFSKTMRANIFLINSDQSLIYQTCDDFVVHYKDLLKIMLSDIKTINNLIKRAWRSFH